MNREWTVLFFDISVQVFYVLVVLVLVLSFWQPKKYFGRWRRWRDWIRAVALVVAGLFVYATLIEPRILTVKDFDLPLVTRQTTNIHAVFLTDLHAGPLLEKDFYDRVVDRTLALKPDVIFLGGDFLEKQPKYLDRLESFKKLTAPLGVYFVLGNHDYYASGDAEAVRTWAKGAGFVDMTNRVMQLQKDGKKLTLIGLDDARMGYPDYALFRRGSDGTPRLLLTHDADALLQMNGTEAEGVLMGHTHGGQVRLPLIGSLAHLPQQAPQWLDRGIKYWNGMPVLISQGLGETVAPIRFDCPPQIAEVEVGI